MQVLTPTQEQYDTLNGYRFNNSELIFVKDFSNKWIVGLEVLQDVNFNAFLNDLKQLEKIEYTPFPNAK